LKFSKKPHEIFVQPFEFLRQPLTGDPSSQNEGVDRARFFVKYFNVFSKKLAIDIAPPLANMPVAEMNPRERLRVCDLATYS
jgi:hypothetical protein